MRFYATPVPKLEVAAATEKSEVGQLKPQLLHPYLDTETQELWATDTHVLVRIPVMLDEGDKSGPVSAEALAAARKAKSAGIRLSGFNQEVMPAEFDGTQPTKGKKAMKPVETLKRPEPLETPPGDVLKVWPSQREVKQGFRVGFDVNLLVAAAQAVGAQEGKVELVFMPTPGQGDEPNPLTKVLVRPKGGKRRDEVPKNGVRAPEVIVMPLRLDPDPDLEDDEKPARNGRGKTKGVDDLMENLRKNVADVQKKRGRGKAKSAPKRATGKRASLVRETPKRATKRAAANGSRGRAQARQAVSSGVVCKGKSKGGDACGRPASPGSKFCFVHDPKTKAERMRRRAAREKARA